MDNLCQIYVEHGDFHRLWMDLGMTYMLKVKSL